MFLLFALLVRLIIIMINVAAIMVALPVVLGATLSVGEAMAMATMTALTRVTFTPWISVILRLMAGC